MIAHLLRADGFDSSEDGTGRGIPLTVGTLSDGEPSLTCNHEAPIGLIPRGIGIDGGNVGFTLRSNPSHSGDKGDGGVNTTMVAQGYAVRRLTPRECERLMGFPDDYTAIPYRNKSAAAGPRYKALGNSMAVPVIRWIGERIEAFDFRQ